MDDNAMRARLDVLRQEVKGCHRCALAARRREAVFGEGAMRAPLMIIGEAPGRDEDKEGRPFIGRAGRILARLLDEVGVTRRQVWITNAVACWPPPDIGDVGKWQGKPQPEHVAACRGHVEAQIDAIGPRVVLCLGSVAAASMLPDIDMRHTRMGMLLDWQRRRGLRSSVHPNVRVAYHPSYLLRTGMSESGPIPEGPASDTVQIFREAWAAATAPG